MWGWIYLCPDRRTNTHHLNLTLCQCTSSTAAVSGVCVVAIPFILPVTYGLDVSTYTGFPGGITCSVTATTGRQGMTGSEQRAGTFTYSNNQFLHTISSVFFYRMHEQTRLYSMDYVVKGLIVSSILIDTNHYSFPLMYIRRHDACSCCFPLSHTHPPKGRGSRVVVVPVVDEGLTKRIGRSDLVTHVSTDLYPQQQRLLFSHDNRFLVVSQQHKI